MILPQVALCNVGVIKTSWVDRGASAAAGWPKRETLESRDLSVFRSNKGG